MKIKSFNEVCSISFFEKNNIFGYGIVQCLESILLLFFLFFGMSVFIIDISSYFSISFYYTSLLIFTLFVLFSLSLLGYMFVLFRSSVWDRSQTHILGLLLLVSVFGALVNVSINRPDLDDSVYVPKAVFYLENPDFPLNTDITWIASSEEIKSLSYFTYYELTQASVSLFLNSDFLFLYHIFFPCISTFLLIFSYFLLCLFFANHPKSAICGALFVILLSLVLGETHRTFGNISLARLFHGKFVFIAMAIPVWTYFTIRFFSLNDKISWLGLLFIGVASAGMTTSALVMLPFLSLILASSLIFTESKNAISLKSAYKVLLYFCSLIPLVLIALNFRFYAIERMVYGTLINSSFPISFEGQLHLMLNQEYPFTFISLLFSILFILFIPQCRRFFLLWAVITIVLLFNPLVSYYVMKYFTTENIYWRIFYLLPFPLIACVVFSYLCQWGTIGKITALSFSVLIFILGLIGPTSIFSVKNSAAFSFGSYKVPLGEYDICKQMIHELPPGTMFAPLELSSYMVLLSSYYQQWYVREDFLLLSLPDEARILRLNAYSYLYRENISEQAIAAFRQIIESPGRPGYIVVSVDSANTDSIKRELWENGYKEVISMRNYIVFSSN